MNKLYFEGKAVDLYAEDYQYLQDSLADEGAKITRAITGNISTPVISSGFIPRVSTGGDDSTIEIYHTTTYGSLLTATGVLAETTGVFDDIALSDATLNVVNYIYAKVTSTYATYQISDGTTVFEIPFVFPGRRGHIIV